MSFVFKQIPQEEIEIILPLVQKLTNYKYPDELLLGRIREMAGQNYECVGIYDGDKLIGCSGLWFMTRHYAGKSVEADHVYIEEDYRSKGLGKKFFQWIYEYAKNKGCEAVELNTYVNNHPSHKFYYNEGFAIYGYHFFKKL
ncbi:GNAT family N-acetyltransferase [Leptobacterium flavescens]|uniref:GNAT family N-acetyltransferase n=1 Tax=Leptobacterium flavescens TaxID=472055 RepID=A0A6P0UGR5_9FLAO|nr:GNAT family N-acetyltransferase [Leptobacterium flavescens]NER12435.1 GNAT family N-acetyltransferase [Leptobacterium flavescens]